MQALCFDVFLLNITGEIIYLVHTYHTFLGYLEMRALMLMCRNLERQAIERNIKTMKQM